jgi:thiamine kinase-like enzyme
VSTHNDLNIRNIIVGRNGKLWLVDWVFSGFYPPLCESIATQSAAVDDNAPKELVGIYILVIDSLVDGV